MVVAVSESHKRKKVLLILGAVGGVCLAAALLVLGIYFINKDSQGPKDAPESARVLEAQTGLPFQVLIPAYLPPIFKREAVELTTDARGPNGESMIKLIYPTRKGNQLVLSEWIPESQDIDQSRRCICVCREPGECISSGVEMTSGAVRIKIELSIPNLVTNEQMQYVLETLGPAANQQMYSYIQEVPVSYSLPAAVEVPANAEGIQEITLVVSPQGYSPAHFSVTKDIPVRLIFRQLGQVGCGNELIFDWGAGKNADLILASPQDKQVLEFTPAQAGVFSFHCPHFIYRGAMTVKE